MAVRKSGRSTGLTSGTVIVIAATVNVTYGAGQVATFENQVVAGPMSQGGDSGSLVLAGNSLRAVGLLFAGSEQSTIFSPIDTVLDTLQVDLPAAATSRTWQSSAGAQAISASPTRPHDSSSSQPDPSKRAATARAQAVREAYINELLSKPNVVGVGVGIPQRGGQPVDEVGLVVMVEKKVPRDELRPQDLVPYRDRRGSCRRAGGRSAQGLLTFKRLNASTCPWMARSVGRRSMLEAPKKPAMPGMRGQCGSDSLRLIQRATVTQDDQVPPSLPPGLGDRHDLLRSSPRGLKASPAPTLPAVVRPT